MTERELTSLLSKALTDRIWIKASRTGVLEVATVAEYPDGAGVGVFVRQREDGAYDLTDMGETSRWLGGQGLAESRLAEVAPSLVRPAGVRLDGDALVLGRIPLHAVPEAILTLSATAVRCADAVVLTSRRPGKRSEFTGIVVDALTASLPRLIARPQLRGASGRTYQPALLDPEAHTVVEAISSRRTERIAAVYTEMSDLKSANGFRPFVVLDDRTQEWSEPDIGLLLQVGQVALWGGRSNWIPTVFSAEDEG